MIRQDAVMPISRFCALFGVPRRSYFRCLARLRSGEGLTRRRTPAPATECCALIVATYIAVWPELGHRTLHALMAADGHVTSPSTVLRAMRLVRQAEYGHREHPGSGS